MQGELMLVGREKSRAKERGILGKSKKHPTTFQKSLSTAGSVILE